MSHAICFILLTITSCKTFATVLLRLQLRFRQGKCATANKSLESDEDDQEDEEPEDDLKKLTFWSFKYYRHYRTILLPDHVQAAYMCSVHPKI